MCYAVPTAGAIVTTMFWMKSKDVKTWWLMLLFVGGAMFGVIDHWWNGELFLISENIVSDVFLGVVISLAIVICWKFMIASSKSNVTLMKYMDVKKV